MCGTVMYDKSSHGGAKDQGRRSEEDEVKGVAGAPRFSSRTPGKASLPQTRVVVFAALPLASFAKLLALPDVAGATTTASEISDVQHAPEQTGASPRSPLPP